MSINWKPLSALLNRSPVVIDPAPLKSLLAGRRVLVTGAGGTIGAELARQAAANGCAHLSLLDHSGGAVWAIDQEIAHAWPTLSRQEIICDVRDRAGVARWLRIEKPDLVFHAAALKHVNLVERHPTEGVAANFIGASNVADAVMEAGRGVMVLISTDKAASPASLMGASKRLAEWLVQDRDAAAAPFGATKPKFAVVRFGNVLGSAGSVAPIFLDQIRKGGPVRVTHPDMERYFMTVTEAVELTLRATALRESREAGPAGVFVLEMGAPVKILELAQRMIAAYGDGRDIPIAFTGLRDGEVLQERLYGDDEQPASSGVDGIMEVAPRTKRVKLSPDLVADLDRLCREGDDLGLRGRMAGIFPALGGADGRALRGAGG